MTQTVDGFGRPAAREREVVATLFALGRQVTSVLSVDELLPRIPQLIRRLIAFDALAVYLLDEKRQDLTVAFAEGYPASADGRPLAIGEGLVGAAVESRETILVNDVTQDPRYVPLVPGMCSELVVPLMRKGRPLGALNLLSAQANQFEEPDAAILRQFGAHVSVALENARLFDGLRQDAEVFAALAAIGREMTSILDLDALLARVAQLTHRLIAYRTFGIFLLNEETRRLDMKLAIKYGEQVTVPSVPLGEGLVGFAALHREPVRVADVARDPRYINLVDDVRSELVIPLLVQDRCIGVFDLESPELDAFDQRAEEILTLLASQAAVAIQNAQLYEAVRANELRLEREVRFAQRVQAALLPAGPARKLRGVDVAARFAPARELGGDFYDFVVPDSQTIAVAVGDVSGKGVPAALYSAFAAELVRGRTFRRRYTALRSSPAGVLASINTILHERQLEEYYCTLCYMLFDLKRRTVAVSNSGLPYPIRCAGEACGWIELPGIPLGSFPGSTYDELTYPIEPGDLYVFCTDGVSDSMNRAGEEFGRRRLLDTVAGLRGGSAREIVEGVFEAVRRFRGDVPLPDDMTCVAVRLTGEGKKQDR